MPRKKKIKSHTLPVQQNPKRSRFVVDLNTMTEKVLPMEEDQSKGRADWWQKAASSFWTGAKAEEQAQEKAQVETNQSNSIQEHVRNFEPELKEEEILTAPVSLLPDDSDFTAADQDSRYEPEKEIDFSFLVQEEKKEKNHIDLKSSYKDLAFLNLFQFIFFVFYQAVRAFYKFCHAVGWTSVYLARLVFLFFYYVGKAFYYLMSGIASGLVTHFVILFDSIHEFKAAKDDQRATFVPPKEKVAEPLISSRDVDIIYNADTEIPKFDWRRLFPQFHWEYVRPTVYFSLTVLIILLPFKAFSYYKSLNLDMLQGRVLGASESALSKIKEAGSSAVHLRFDKAGQDFSQAGANFLEAQKQLEQVNSILLALAGLVPSQKMHLAASADHILSSGEIAARLGKDLSLAMGSILGPEKNKEFKQGLENFVAYGQRAVDDAQSLKNEIGQIDSASLPAEFQEKFQTLKDKAGFVTDSLSEFIDLARKAQDILGLEQDKRYLLVFQNNAEMRGSGGFIGSYALVDFRNGKIKNMEIPHGGSYDTKAGLKERILTPEPLQLLGTRWRFWDANWWPDWPTSARKLEWFYERSDGPTVDGVIAFTPTSIENILDVIGPVEMKSYGLTIDSQNFWPILEEYSEEKKTGSTTPKKIISDLMSQIVAELPSRLSGSNMVNIIKAAEKDFAAKQILLYFNEADIQKKAEEMGWTGCIKSNSGDYFMVANTNVGGGKSDRKMKESINHQAQVLLDGTIIDTVTITRAHSGGLDDKYIGVNNIDWMRVYVPAGSLLLDSSGWNAPDPSLFKKPEEGLLPDADLTGEINAEVDGVSGTKIYQEAGHTVFANWSQVKPGQTVQIVLKYKLPFKLEDMSSSSLARQSIWNRFLSYVNMDSARLYPYSLLVQKQPGANIDDFSSAIDIDSKYKIIWQDPEINSGSDSNGRINSRIDSDKSWGMIMENR